MENTEFKVFLFKNQLKQTYIADYVGVTTSFVSQVASGARSMPNEMLAKIINNDQGWDVSMFGVESDFDQNAPGINDEAEMMRDMYMNLLSERDEKIRLLELEICRLRMKLNGR